MLLGLTLKQSMALNELQAAEYRLHTLDNQTYQEVSLFQLPEIRRLGFQRLSSVIQDRKKSNVDRLVVSPPIDRSSVAEILERSRSLQGTYHKMGEQSP